MNPLSFPASISHKSVDYRQVTKSTGSHRINRLLDRGLTMPQATRRGPQSQSKRQHTEDRRIGEDKGQDMMDLDDVDEGADDDDGETGHSQSNAEGQSQNLERVRLQLTYAAEGPPLRWQHFLTGPRDMQEALGMAADQGKGKDTWPRDMDQRLAEAEERLKSQLRDRVKER